MTSINDGEALMLNGEDLMDKSIMLNKSEYGLMVSRMLSG